MQNHSGGDSVALGIVPHFPHLLVNPSPPVPLREQLGVKQVKQQQQCTVRYGSPLPHLLGSRFPPMSLREQPGVKQVKQQQQYTVRYGSSSPPPLGISVLANVATWTARRETSQRAATVYR